MDTTRMGFRRFMDHDHDLFFHLFVSGLFKIFVF
jgi:hypothetical protein